MAKFPSKKNKNIREIKNYFAENIAQFCDKCGTPYKTNDIKVMESHNSTYLLQATCGKCKNMHLATVVKNAGVSTKMHLKLDLKQSEIKRALSLGKINSDEILTFYSMLKQSDNVSTFLEKLKR